MAEAPRISASSTAMTMVVPGLWPQRDRGRRSTGTVTPAGAALGGVVGQADEVQLVALGQAQVGGRAAPVDRDREQAVAVDDQAHLAGADLVVGVDAGGGASALGGPTHSSWMRSPQPVTSSGSTLSWQLP